jgi:formate dehydrogenase gamma subunit
MSEQNPNSATSTPAVQLERVFQRFSNSQRWEHWILLASFTTLLLTGLPQKYRTSTWSQQLIATPEQLALIQTIHHIAAIVLILEVIYHLGKAIYRMARRNMPDDMFVSWQDFRDAGKMLAYLFFLRKDKPAYGKYSFEEKVTYWFIFIGVGIMLVSGLILWFPELITRFLPGGVIPAAMLAHSTEAVVAGIFVVIWHFFHVHFQRLNLSIFSGKINEKEMQAYHALEYERLMAGKPVVPDESGGEKT